MRARFAVLTMISFLPLASAAQAADPALDCLRLEGDAAIAACDQAVQANPKDARSVYQRAAVRYRNKDLNGAFADLTLVVKIDPEFEYAYSNRADILRKNGDFAGAIADYGHAVKINPDSPSNYYERGIAERDKGDKAAALADFQKAHQLDPTDADTVAEIGKLGAQPAPSPANKMTVIVDQAKGIKKSVTCRDPIDRDNTTMTCSSMAESFKIVVAPMTLDGESQTVECADYGGLFAYKSGSVRQCRVSGVILLTDRKGREIRCEDQIVLSSRGGVESCFRR